MAWFNGKIVPEDEVADPIPRFKLALRRRCLRHDAQLRREPVQTEGAHGTLDRSLKYLRIDPGMSAEKMIAISEDVFERNCHLLGPDEDYWIGQRVSRGVKDVPGDNLDYHGPNVVVECMPLPFRQRARLFIEGIKVMVPSHRRTPPE